MTKTKIINILNEKIDRLIITGKKQSDECKKFL